MHSYSISIRVSFVEELVNSLVVVSSDPSILHELDGAWVEGGTTLGAVVGDRELAHSLFVTEGDG